MKIKFKKISTLALIAAFATLIFSCKPNADESPDSEKPYTQDIDLLIDSTDFGTDWSQSILLDASKFLDMVSGDFITFTIEESDSPAEYFQIQFCDSEWNDFFGKALDIEKVPTKFEFHPTDEILAKIKSSGLKVKGYGIKITKAVLTTTSSLLSDRNATDNAKKLYSYINQVYGKKVITGIMENAWNDECNMLERVKTDTGKYPALDGFDFMNYTGVGYSASKNQTQRAINFWNGKDYSGKKISDNHGIVAFCWHWRNPIDTPASNGANSYAPSETSFRIPYDTEKNEWKTESNEYKKLVSDLDTIAAELLVLQSEGVPVLWRPLHEGAGNVGLYGNTGSAWFWWGAGNSTTKKDENSYEVSTDPDNCGECYIALWKLMYDYFTNKKGIHNLIWVWNGQNQKFYPGSQYVDIIGTDIYPWNNYDGSDPDGNTARNYGSQKDSYTKCVNYDKSKPVALTECGAIPSMENISKDNAWWSYFMVWNDGHSNNGVTRESHGDNFWSGEFHNTDSHKKEVYGSDIAITLDELPDLTK